MDEDEIRGCGCLVVCALAGLFMMGSCIRASQEKSEHEAQEAAAKSEAEHRALQKENRLCAFILNEAPALWMVYQNLKAAVAAQDSKIVRLRETICEFGRNPDMDADFRDICAMRNDMVASLNTLRIKIEDAYLASLKYEATPSRVEYDALRRKLIEDGMQEAEAAARRFDDMRRVK